MQYVWTGEVVPRRVTVRASSVLAHPELPDSAGVAEGNECAFERPGRARLTRTERRTRSRRCIKFPSEVLALDTTTVFGSVALRIHRKLVGERHIHSSDGFAHVIFQQIEACRPNQPVCFRNRLFRCGRRSRVLHRGPRGLTAAKGLAEALKKPVAAVSNLRALAAFGESERRAVVLDARRGEVYAAVYDAEVESSRARNRHEVFRVASWVNRRQL